VFCGSCSATQYCSATPSVNGGALGSCQDGGALAPAQKQKAEMLTSIWENDTTNISYSYSSNIGDGRGYTSGRAGFCTGTGDAIIVVECYDLAKPGNVMQKYMPGLIKIQAKFVASGGMVLQGSTAEVDSIGNFKSDWGTAASDPVFKSCQDYVVDAVYYGVAMKHVASKKFTTALTKAALYDAQINMGETDPKFGVVKMMSLADAQAGALANPPTMADESKWLGAFLQIRANIMRNDPTWKTNTYRCANYEKLRLAGNFDLSACILTNAQSSTYWSGYPSGSSSVFKIVTSPSDPNKAVATSGGSCP
jgi:chitosanase